MAQTRWSEQERSVFEVDLRAKLNSIYGARPWLACSGILQGATQAAEELLAAGAPSAFAIGAVSGIGEIPETVPSLSLGLVPSGSLVDALREQDALLHDPPQSALDAVEEFDPDRRARSVLDFTLTGGIVCGRPAFGARLPEWEALEDKLFIEPVWAAANIKTAPAIDVDLSASLLDTHRQLASAEGTVWAVDNNAGWHGGADGTYWVPDESHLDDTIRPLIGRHTKARVMPFVEGTPCSIHGMVVDGTTIAFRPMELMIYRDRANRKIVYGKASGYWTPSPSDRNEMIEAAVRLGDELYKRVAYRGAFTLDGIMSQDGFVPTEVNTRFGAALPGLISTLDGDRMNLFLIHLAIIEGVLDVDPALLHAWVLDELDTHLRCFGMLETANGPNGDQQLAVARVDGEFVQDGEPVLANITWGRRGEGGLMFIVGTDEVPIGPPTAPLVLELANYANRIWDAGLPVLEPARAVRV